MKILVTGSSGFIGKHVVALLKQNPANEIIETSAHAGNNQRFDLSISKDDINLYDYFNQPDILIHLAWWGLPNFKDEIHITQIESHIKFINNLVANGLKKVVITGTCQEYGMQEGCLSENMEIYPHTNYSIGKNKLRIAIEDLQKTIPFDFNWIRLFYMYGNGQNAKSVLSLLAKAIENNEETFNMSPGDQKRDFLPVENVAKNIIQVAFQSKYNGVVNCCSGNPITVKEQVENFIKKNNAHIKLNAGFYNYPDYEPFAFWGNNTLLKTLIL